MFPGAGASVYYNEAGEPLGWDSGYADEPDAYEECDGPDYDDDEEDDEEPDAEEDESWRDDEEREGDGTSLAAEFRSAERLLGSW